MAVLMCMTGIVEDIRAQEEVSAGEQLLVAADKGDTLVVLQLLSKGVDVNTISWEGVTPLMYACQNGNIAMMSLLLRQGADPDKKPANGYTALITAAGNGMLDVAEMLLRHGANINLPDNNKKTPLLHAISVDSFYMPDLLLYYGAEVDPADRNGMDALMLASKLGRTEIAARLIESGADVNSADLKKRSPLHYATLGDHKDIMEMLINAGALLENRTISGYTPLSLAAVTNNFTAARLLIGYGADVNSKVSCSTNPLTIALENKNDSLAGMLMNNEAKAIRLPVFNQVTFGGEVTFNGKDVLTGFSLGLSDKRYHLWTGIAYQVRPRAIRVLEGGTGQNYYQYWERRHVISLTLDKAFYLPGSGKGIHAGLVAGMREGITFGSYRGAAAHPDVKLLFSPRIGGILTWQFLRLRLMYEFMDLKLEDVSRGWCGFSLQLMFNRKNSIEWNSLAGN